MATSGARSEPPLVVIVGPTASGKTGLSIALAREFDGEIISADSRAIYRHLSIGTAKPSIEEQQGVPHWGIDLIDPGERFTAADFQQYAKAKIAEIRAHGAIPFLVGGTGLYIDAVVYDFVFPQTGSTSNQRDALEELSLADLHDYCHKNNITLPENYKNKRHIINAILRDGANPQRKHELDTNTIVVGIATEKDFLNKRITDRAHTIFAQGIVDEAVNAAKKYGWDNEAMTGNVYPLIREYVMGNLAPEAVIERFIISDRQLAKKQMTWFKRNPHVQWYSLPDARKYLAQKLSDLSKS